MFSKKTLDMLPTDSIGAAADFFTSKAKSQAFDLAAQKGRINRLLGSLESDSIFSGKTITKLRNTLAGLEKYAGYAKSAYKAYKFVKTFMDGRKEPFVEGTLPEDTVVDQDAVDTMGEEITAQLTPEADGSLALDLAVADATNKVAAMQAELQQTLETLDQLNEVLEKRASGELPNPVLNLGELQAATENIIADMENSAQFSDEQIAQFREAAFSVNEARIENYERFVVNNVSKPFADNKARLNILKARALGLNVDSEEDAPIFDTVFGPPISTEGKFILSEDGIYYDSRTGSIPYITAQKIDSLSWQLRYDSNRGGRGQAYSQDNTLRFADTVLSDAYENETPKVLEFYKYDDILTNLENDRDLQIRDVKGKVADLIASGYDASSAIVKNYEESYASVAYTYDRKIKKRKKQLQIAALFGPFGVTPPGDLRGEGLFYREYQKQQSSLIENLCGSETKVQPVTFSGTGNDEIEFIPRIPVNDFSYLKEIGLIPELETQKQAMLHSSDLDDTTAPIVPVFLEQGPGARFEAIPELAISPYGTANFVNTSGDTGASAVASATVSGVAPYLRTLDDDIVTDELVVCYNFLESKAPTIPASNDFSVKNYVDNGYPLNAKMVGDASSIFVSGISIPYLRGTLYSPGTKYGVRYSHLGKGSYVRLPNNYRDDKPYTASQPLDNLMYNPRGWGMDFWVYAPDLYDGMTVDHRYKLVAANENCGDPVSRSFSTSIFTTASPDFLQGLPRDFRTKGMIIGFRDKGDPGTDVSAGLEFVVLPTIAQNNPEWGQSVCIAESVSGEGSSAACRSELGFKVPASATTESGYSIADASAGFTHYNIACDTSTDTISLYVNGEFLASALVSTSFETKPGVPLQIPSKIGQGHYHEQSANLGEKLYDRDLPQTPIFTPWILGGGFTDGISQSPFTQPGAVPQTTVPGFLGTNTNTSYFSSLVSDASGGPVGQHSIIGSPGVETAGLGGFAKSGTNYKIARSGLDGHLGSFKMYAKPLSTLEVEKNYKAQSPYFNGIARPYHLL
jgi:hypothetical protein